MYRVTLSNGMVLEHLSYADAWDLIQEYDGCIVEEEECMEH